MQRGGFASEEDARAALERTLAQLRRERGIGRTPTLAEFVDEYLAQHDASPVTLKCDSFAWSHAGGGGEDHHRSYAAAVDVRGRPVDVETRESRPSRQRKQPLSRR